jgi:hypothetical protein
VIDYFQGRIKVLSSGAIADGAALDVDYDYYKYRQGEMQAIDRGKVTLDRKLLEIAASRLATQISRETIVFSRSQLGWDAVGRTLFSLVRQIQRRIDQGLLYLALETAHGLANNSGGEWDSDGSIDELVEMVGLAKVKVANRYYDPTFVVLSATNSDRVANWDNFTAAGKRPDSDLNANGYIGRLKGLACFETTEFPDDRILVGNRELVHYRVFRPMQILGPYHSVDQATAQQVAAEEYYTEQFDGAIAPVAGKGAYVVIV